MSEAADPEREVEDFFNEEIFGAKPEADPEPVFPTEAPPEPKPLEEIAIEDASPEEGTPEGTEEAPVSEEVAPEQGEPEALEETPEDAEAHLTWARKKYGDELDVEKLAKAAYEQEKLIGQKAENERRLEQERQEFALEQQRQQVQAQIDYLSSPGSLTAEEDAWIDDAISSDDPAGYADSLIKSGRHDLYGSFVSRWVQQGDLEAQQAMAHRDHVLAWATQPAPPQPTKTEAIARTVQAVCAERGLDPAVYGDKILTQLGQLPEDHWTRQAFNTDDPRMWMSAFQGTLDLVAAGNTTVHAARQNDVVQQRVQEEQLRQNAAGIQKGGPRVEQPKSSPFWDSFNSEVEQINSRPTYGRGEE